jgi:hypothetical protein
MEKTYTQAQQDAALLKERIVFATAGLVAGALLTHFVMHFLIKK